IITAARTTIGAEGNLVDPRPESSRHIRLETPVLTNDDLEKLRQQKLVEFQTITLPILFKKSGGPEAMEQELEELFIKADQAYEAGATLLILSDRGVDEEHVRSEEHTSELQSRENLVCRLLLEKQRSEEQMSGLHLRDRL